MPSFARRQFPGIEVARLNCAKHAFAPHFHDEFVLSVNIRGPERIKLDRKILEADEGEITLYNPAQVQSSHALASEWQFLSLYVDPSFLPDALDLPAETVFEKPILRDRIVAERMARSIEASLQNEVTNGEALEHLVQVVENLLSKAGSRRVAVPRSAPTAIHRIAERLRDARSLPSFKDLAQSAGLSPVQLVRSFARFYGLPPFHWAVNIRLNEARRRLEKGLSIAEIAAELGFSDQAHLTRRFRALYGVPPGRWRRG